VSAAFANITAGPSNTQPPPAANPDHTARETAQLSQASGGMLLSFDDLKVDPLGNEIGSAEAPTRMAAKNAACPRPLNSDC
jgi:hypothetical protein